MNRMILAAVLLAGTAFTALPARADGVIDDPLHGFCLAAACVDNGTNTPIPSNPPVGWGFTISPGPQTGNLVVDFLVPDSAVPQGGAGINILTHGTTTVVANAQLVSTTPWTSGFLDAYLGLNASPANPLDAYLPSTLTLLGNPANVNGFFVFQASLGMLTLPGPSGTPPLFDANKGAQGMYIVGFFNGNVATANSGALFDTGPGNTINPVINPVPGPIVGAGIPGLIAACGALFGFNWRRRRRLLGS